MTAENLQIRSGYNNRETSRRNRNRRKQKQNTYFSPSTSSERRIRESFIGNATAVLKAIKEHQQKPRINQKLVSQLEQDPFLKDKIISIIDRNWDMTRGIAAGELRTFLNERNQLIKTTEKKTYTPKQELRDLASSLPIKEAVLQKARNLLSSSQPQKPNIG